MEEVVDAVEEAQSSPKGGHGRGHGIDHDKRNMCMMEHVVVEGRRGGIVRRAHDTIALFILCTGGRSSSNDGELL